MPTIKKVRCEKGCARADDLGDGVCKRCCKATEEVVEDVVVQDEAEILADLIQTAEEARPLILKRYQSLPDKYKLLVNAALGVTMRETGVHPLSLEGRAMGIILLSVVMVEIVPEEDRPWMVDGEAIDVI